MVSKNIYYKYNPETDNFERVYPTFRSRMLSLVKSGGLALIMAALLFVLVFYFFDSPTERNLRIENNRLRSQYNLLNKRLDNSMKILDHLQDRDDNFYRVMMQMEPLTPGQRLSGLENERRYKDLKGLNDAELVIRLSQNMDLLERQLYAQLQSFDQLRMNMAGQEVKLEYIPSVIPLKEYSVACGYGVRRDPVTSVSRMHEGIDLAAPAGTEVYATGKGVVVHSERVPGYGNMIEIDHGYHYVSRYAHLGELLVTPGDTVERGALIGKVGSTGKSSAPHLHYEVKFKDEPQNPVNYYFMDLTPEKFDEMILTAENAGYLMD